MIRAFSFLQRDPQSGLLHFRLRVPGHLQNIVGKTEIKRSLRTADKRVAMPVAFRLYCELTDYFKRLGSGEPMRKPTKRKAKQDADGFISKITFDEIELPTGTKAKGITIDTGNDKKDVALAKELLGVIVATTPAATAPAVDSAKLLKVAEKYRAEKIAEGSWTPKTHDEHQALHELISRVTGNIDIGAIGHKEARQFKETLLSLPANMGKGSYAGKSVRQLLSMNIPDNARMHPRTVNEKLQRASSLFGWAVRHGYTAVNPFERLKLRLSGRASEERAVFDDDDLRTIFDPVRFSLEKLRKPFQYWCPLLALYTGARAQELAQLRVVDVIERDGIWAIFISKEAGKLKTKASHREIPLHPAIIERGFLEYVERIRAAGHERLFPEAWDTQNGPGDKLSRWFAVYRKSLKIGSLKKGDGLPVKCLHSFRHCFINGLKQAGADTLKIKQLSGHDDPDIATGRYGKGYPLQPIYEVVCLLNFDLE
jgi:integrase